MAHVKTSKITINQFPIYDYLVEQLDGHTDVVDLDDEEVLRLFLDVVSTTTAKCIDFCGIEAKKFADHTFYTSSRSPFDIPYSNPLASNKKEYGYKWESVSHIKTGSRSQYPLYAAWYCVSLTNLDECFASIHPYQNRNTHFYPAPIARHLLQSFILFLRGEEKYKEIWALGLIDPCSFSITSAINTYNRTR